MRGVGFMGRQQSKSPGTEVGVAGHRAGMVESEDQGPTQPVPHAPFSRMRASHVPAQRAWTISRLSVAAGPSSSECLSYFVHHSLRRT